MKILVTGANGLLGQKLLDLLQQKENVHLIATARNPLAQILNRGEFHFLDVTDKSNVEHVISETTPDVIINAAAMTQVDACETEWESCILNNVTAVEFLTASAAKVKARFIHISTDFIFDGKEGPLTEEAIPSPVNFYGKSKLQAERIIQKTSLSFSILRTVLVYGTTPGTIRSNLVLWVKSSLEQGKTIQVVNDQWRTPTLAEDLAMGCYLAAEKKVTGIYNISGKDFMTPYDMAIMTAEIFGLDKKLIQKTDSSSFRQTATRPLKTGFVIDKAKKELGYAPHSFKEGLLLIKKQVENLS